jgi:hypothetical protein
MNATTDRVHDARSLSGRYVLNLCGSRVLSLKVLSPCESFRLLSLRQHELKEAIECPSLTVQL